MSLGLGPRLPYLESIQAFLTPDLDTNYLVEYISHTNLRANTTIEITKTLQDKLKNREPLFKSLKQLEWLLEFLGYAFLPPQNHFISNNANYLENIIAIYEYILCGKVELEVDGKRNEFHRVETIVDVQDPSFQKLMVKMLGHFTLLFDEKNFEKKQSAITTNAPISEDEFRVQGRICGFALKIFHKFIFTAHSILLPGTWKDVLRLIIGLTDFLLANHKHTKTPERVNIATIELLFNSWILSGFHGDEIWDLFKTTIFNTVERTFVVSYWIEVCTELTVKLLVDEGCLDAPKFLLLGDKKQIEHQKNLLVINHTLSTANGAGDIGFAKTKSLFPQPFIFQISKKQNQYLWSKMVRMMDTAKVKKNSKTHHMIIKGINNIITLLLKVGIHHKESINGLDDQEKWLSLRAIRKITIKHDFEYFKGVFESIMELERNNSCENVFGYQSEDSPNNPKRSQTLFISSFTSTPTSTFLDTEASTFDLNRNSVPGSPTKYPEFQELLRWSVEEHRIPKGDLLLKLFGGILFEAADSNVSPCSEAHLTSIVTLCQIFSKARGPFDESYLKHFYRLFYQFLNTEIPKSFFQIVIKYSCRLFTSPNTQNSLVIQVSLVKKLLSYYIKQEAQLTSSELYLRTFSNKFCSSLICPLIESSDLLKDISPNERTIKDIFYELLFWSFLRDKEVLETEKLPPKFLKRANKNIARSAWNFFLYSLMNNKISTFIEKINETWFDKTPPSVHKLTMDIFQTIGEMGFIQVERTDDPQKLNDFGFVGLIILERVNSYLKTMKPRDSEHSRLLSPQPLEHKAEKIVSQALSVLYIWTTLLLYLRESLSANNQREFIPLFFATLNTFFTFLKQEPFCAYIQIMLASISSTPGSFTGAKDFPRTGSFTLSNPNSDLKQAKSEYLLHLSLGGDTVLSFFELESQTANEKILFEVRNGICQSIWMGELFYKISSTGEPQVQSLESSNPQEESNSRTNKEEAKETCQFTGQDEFEQMIGAQFALEEEYEHSCKELRTKKSFEEEEGNKGSESLEITDKFRSIRIFLTNSGLLSNNNLQNVNQIPISEESQNRLKIIDSMPTRQQIIGEILYVSDSESNEISEELPAEDKVFQEFLGNLGTVLDQTILNNEIYASVRKRVGDGENKIIYTSNALYETIFKISNLSQPNEVFSAFDTERILVIWNSRSKDIHNPNYPHIINKLEIRDQKIAIIVTPLLNGEFLLDILKQDSSFMTFPPIKGLVCNFGLLPIIIRQLLINIHREGQIHFHQASYLSVIFDNIQKKKNCLTDFIQENQTKITGNEMFYLPFDMLNSEKNNS